MKRRLIDPLVIVIGLTIAICDQLTKQWIVDWIGPASATHQVELVGDWVRFTYVTNTGAAFGLFQGMTSILTIISLLAVPVLIFSPLLFARPIPLVRVAQGMMLGGAVGNLIDRAFQGYVVDFVDVGIGDLRWPAFNVADSSFVVGVVVLGVILLLFPDPEESPGAGRDAKRHASDAATSDDATYVAERG